MERTSAEAVRRQPGRWPAWVVGASVATACATGILAHLMTAPEDRVWLLDTPEPVAGLAFGAVSVLILLRRPRHPLGWLLATISAALAVYTASLHYAVYASAGAQPLPGAVWAGWLARWTWAAGFLPLVTVLPLLYPTGRVVSRRWRPALLLACGISVLATALLALDPAPPEGLHLPNPLGIEAVGASLEVAVAVVGPLVLFSVATGLAAVAVRWRRNEGQARRQLLSFGYAVAVTVALSVFGAVLGPLAEWALAAAVTAVALSIGLAVLRDGILDRGDAVRPGLIWLATGTGLSAVYAATAGTLGALLSDRGGAVPFVAAAATALAFQPLREHLTAELDRLLYGDRAHPLTILAALGDRLRETEDPAAALNATVQVVREGLQLPGVVFEVLEGTRAVAAAAAGSCTPDAERIGLTHLGVTVGRLLLSPRPGDTRLENRDRHVLTELEPQLALVAHAVRLSQELQRSRERVIVAREEERRRLRRDLHDGLGAALAGIAMSLDAAATFTARDATRAAALLRTARSQLADTVEDVRRLVYGLRPPALDDLGLVGALRSTLIEPPSDRQLDVSLEVDGDLTGLPAAVEVAAYRISQEAVANAIRHATAEHIRVRLVLDGALDIEVTDDGVGVPDELRPGVGLTSMRERATELGGTLAVMTMAVGGTRVHAHLPVSGMARRGT